MCPLKSYFPANALPTLETVLKQTKEARVVRRAQAVHEVVAGWSRRTAPCCFSAVGFRPALPTPDK